MVNESMPLNGIKMDCSLSFTAVDPVSGKQGTVNRYVRRRVRDIPLLGCPCLIEIELAQVFISKNQRRIESCELVDTVFISLYATICGFDGWEEIELFAKSKESWFRCFLELPNDIPSYDTI